MAKQRRSFKAYLIEPFQQVHFGLYVSGVSVFFCLLIAGLIFKAFAEQYEQVAKLFEVADFMALLTNDVFIHNAYWIGGTLLVFVGVMTAVVVQRTHRMYGPIVSIQRFVKEIGNGNYAVRLKTRKNDDFQKLTDSLNQMAEALHQKYGSRSDAPMAPPDDDFDNSNLVVVPFPTSPRKP